MRRAELSPTTVEALTAPAYWQGHHIGDGDAVPQVSLQNGWRMRHDRLVFLSGVIQQAIDDTVVPTGQTLPLGTNLGSAATETGIFITHVETLVSVCPPSEAALAMQPSDVS